MPAPIAKSLWNFSVALWAKPGVEALALRLQDRHELDIGLLFYCLWAARTRAQPVGRAGLARALDASRPWREDIIGPLRGVRRRLKAAAGIGDQAALAKAVAAAELAAERQLLEALERESPQAELAATERATDRVEGRARQNLLDYVALLQAEGARLSPAEIAAELDFLARISAAFDGAPGESRSASTA